MKNYAVKKAHNPVSIAIEVPGSKSITNRALLMGAMAEGVSEIKGILFSDDSRYFLQALQDLGFELLISEEKRSVRILGQAGKIPKKEAEIYVGSAGTAARFLTAFLAMGDGKYRIDSSEQMKKRPMKELLVALEEMGAVITYEEEEYSFPLTITGIKRRQQTVSIPLNIDKSSQFLSALLMVAPLRFEKLTVELMGNRNARAYVEMTEQMMKQFGHQGVLRVNEDCYEVMYGNYRGQDYQVEPDVSAACYFYAMAAVTGGSAYVAHMRKDSLQGDMRFIEQLEKMGCSISWMDCNGVDGEQLVLQGPKDGRLKGIVADFSNFSDQALTMAAIAPFADEPVTIKGIAHTRGQESNRVAVICTELGKMGIRCDEKEDSVTIYPGIPKDVTVNTYDDHRVAMAFAVTGLRMEHLVIENPECCKKTFPEYFERLDDIKMKSSS